MKNLDEAVLGVSSLLFAAANSIWQVAQIEKLIPIDELKGDIVGLITQFGGLGLAVWLVYRHTTVTIPKMQEQHSIERVKMAEEFSATIEKIISSHAQEMERKRQDYLESFQRGICRYPEKD